MVMIVHLPVPLGVIDFAVDLRVHIKEQRNAQATFSLPAGYRCVSPSEACGFAATKNGRDFRIIMTPDLPDTSSDGFSIDGIAFRAKPLAPGLYPVSTPIGNLGDVTLRALETLAAADLIVCEDTRVTRTLLDRYGIRRPMAAYHEHNAARERPRLLAILLGGHRVALVSDAGTPLVSDPGYKLVEEAIAAGISVVPIPGASAILAALVAAGLPTDTFLFLGFLPPKATARRNRLATFASVPATLVVYEAPHRAAETLADMADALGPERPGVLARELTKKFEEVRRGSLADLAAGAVTHPPRGEIVLLTGPPSHKEADADDLDALLKAALASSGPGQAAAEVAKTTGLPRRSVYARALVLRGMSGETDGSIPPDNGTEHEL